MSFSIPIIIEETSGINRHNEPVTVGIPFPKGLLKEEQRLGLHHSEYGYLPLQTQTLAKWSDNSIKWALLDFQISADANTTNELKLTKLSSTSRYEDTTENITEISINQDTKSLNVNTGTTLFSINTGVFKPFDRVVVDDKDILNSSESKIILTDDSDTEYEPHIKNIFIETKGNLRTTIKFEGELKTTQKPAFVNFFSRMSFFANSSIVKIDFTIHNPQAAKHPGGLWDLGDPGSIFFKDLSIHTTLNSNEQPTVSYQLNEEPSSLNYQLSTMPAPWNPSVIPSGSHEPNNGLSNMNYEPTTQTYQLTAHSSQLTIYQDSSGGECWKSKNHVNRYGEVKNSFRGYKVYSKGEIVREGFRANPIMSIKDQNIQISGSVQNFWQNFPKALEAKENTLKVRLFPQKYNDLFELQGGEQKTHTIFLNHDRGLRDKTGLEWAQYPLIPRTTPEWYSNSLAIPYLAPKNEDSDKEYFDLVNTAILGKNSFFNRREIIDEYGWRNFGEFYADHEAIGHKGAEPLVSHYNNQYDGIYGSLLQYMRSGNTKWFQLADQLCAHVKDIDVYHTDEDRPEYNRGMFWHTEHYIDAQTSTHRSFSKKHLEFRDKSVYGGGPGLSHNYTTGLLLHYYLTGDGSSFETIKELTSFVENTTESENTLVNYSMSRLRRIKCFIEDITHRKSMVQLGKVYGLNGPGRASGNSLNTLMDSYILSGNQKILKKAEDLIKCSINPDDNITKRELLDSENRWFYIIFLQSLGKYLDVKTECAQFDTMWHYARQSLLNYAEWMAKNEYPYLNRPEKLEHPNETWATQDIRKCNVLLYAAKYSNKSQSETFVEKASFFYDKGINYLQKFETKTLTRPLVLMMLNGSMHSYFKSQMVEDIKIPEFSETFQKTKFHKHYFYNLFGPTIRAITNFSLKREVQFLKWRLIAK